MLAHQQRTLIRLLIGAVILLVGAYFAAGFYYHITVKKSVDDFVQYISPYTELSYEDLVTDISGVVHVKDVTLVPRGVRDPITIKQLVLIGPDAWYLLQNNEFLTGDDFAPERMEIRLEGMRLNLGSDLAQNIQQEIKQAAMQRGQQDDTCGMGGMADFAMLKAMGISDLLLDAVIDYSFNSIDNTLQARLSFESADMNKLSLGVEMGDISLQGLQTGVGQIPSLSSLDFNYRVEPQFGARLLMACAGESGGSPLEYQEKLATHAAAGLDQIYAMEEVGQSLSQSVRAFYQQWGDFYLTAHPASPIGMLNLLFMQPDELTQAMKISIRINNNPVQYLKPGPAQQSRERREEASLADLLGLESADKKQAKTSAPRYRRQYVQVDFDDLNNHINEKVRVYTGEFPTRIGKLVKATKNEVSLEQSTHGGKFTAHILRDNVLRAEVRMLKKEG